MGPEAISLRQHLEALRAADALLAAERDRRYSEVGAEREKALKIKESADEKALDLASQIQTYKDQQHNGLLQQLTEERGRYATQGDLKSVVEKLETAIKPLADYVSGQRGGSETKSERRLDVSQVIAVIAVIALVVSILIPHLK